MRPIPLSFQDGERHCMPSPSTSLFDSSPFRTNTRRVASCSIIIARSSSSKVTICFGSSFSAMLLASPRLVDFVDHPHRSALRSYPPSSLNPGLPQSIHCFAMPIACASASSCVGKGSVPSGW